MKLSALLPVLAIISAVGGHPAAIPSETTEPTEVTTAPRAPLLKRYQKVRAKPSTETTSSSSSESQRPWRRTIYGSVVEIVTPTVIQGVTFNAKPPAETGKALPWVSLNKDGSPKTIKPQVKNGNTKNASPDYSTYFQTATTVTYNYEELKAHNMNPDEIHEEVEYIDEDKTYVSLNPIIRCTPDRYFKKGLDRLVDSAPFCTPKEKSELKLGKTYFITWYSRYFNQDVSKVRLHFSYVKERAIDKGMKKRDINAAFFTTEWLINEDGLYPFEIEEEWLLDKFEQYIGVSIQPDNVSDEEFDLLENTVTFRIMKGAKVIKKNKETRRKEDEGISSDSAYYIIMSIPTVVVFFALGAYVFLFITRRDRDFSSVRDSVKKHRILGKFVPKSKNHKYTELPQFKKGNNKLA